MEQQANNQQLTVHVKINLTSEFNTTTRINYYDESIPFLYAYK